jgi:16S rRNA pseudouridine516 synthase
MVAAAGNRVEALHRESFGPFRLDALAAGTWRWPDPTEAAAVHEILRR